MKIVIFWSLCCLTISATENSTEIAQPHTGSQTTHNTQTVEKEISEYTKLLEGVQQDDTPLGAMLKAHYSEHLVNLKKLLESDETGKNIEGKLYQLHQTDSLFSRYY